MLKSLVADLVGAFTPPSLKASILPRRVQYTAFRVDDDKAAKELHDWYVARQEGLGVIREFVRENFTLPLMNKECPYYYLDNEGRLEKVAYTGRVPEGWGGIPHTHWLEPKTSDAVRDVDSLPKPSLRRLHEIMEWPTFEEKWFHSHDLETIRCINHMVTAYNDGNATYVNAPNPESFADFPRIHSSLVGWEKPSWLVPVHEGVAPARKLIFV